MAVRTSRRGPIAFSIQPRVVYIEEDLHSLGWCYQILLENRTESRLTIVTARTRHYRGQRLVLEEHLGPAEIARHAKPADAASLWFRPEAYTRPHRPVIPAGGRLRWSDNVQIRLRGCGVTRAVHQFVLRRPDGSACEAECVVPLRRNQQATRLRLPFDGWWQMLLGHEHFEHHMRGGGGMGMDFVGLGEGGAPHRGTGEALTDWPCYGREVVAPAAGRVVHVANAFPESPPGRPLRVGHNAVVIDHGNGEQTFLAHFIPGSIGVAVGQEVTVGQNLGRCGSSGYSLCPHVHVGLSRNGVGVPIVFSDYQALWPVEDAPEQFSLVPCSDRGVIRHGTVVRHVE